MGKFLIGEATMRIGNIQQSLVLKLIRAGKLPEFGRAGRFYVLDEDKVATVRERLVREGHIKLPGPATATA